MRAVAYRRAGHVLSRIEAISYLLNRCPIGWRPTPREAADLFESVELSDGLIVDGGNWGQWNATERGDRAPVRFIGRLCCPFYNLDKWREVAAQSP